MATHHEMEHTYAPRPDAELPALGELPGVDRVGEPTTVGLVATYFDTHDYGLLRAGVTLRRRTGGSDEGWHLKVPAGDGRDEIRKPLGRAARTPPKGLRDLVAGHSRGAPLREVATIETRRTERPLCGPDGKVLAVLADDHVTGTRADGQVVEWREWELELVAGDPDLLAAADELLAENGSPPVPGARKIARLLGDQVPEPVQVAKPKSGKPTARVVQARLAEQVAELGRRDVQVRQGDPEGTHRARVACRRLRALLATYRPMVDRERTDPVRDELRWLARSLGEARDARIVHERLSALLEEEPAEAVVGPVAGRLRRTYKARARRGRELALEALTSQRYFDLRHTLDELVADPPWSSEADQPAKEVVPGLLEKEWKRVRRRMRALEDTDDVDVAVHGVRKAAKRLRYAAEAAEPALGKPAKRVRRAAKDLTSHAGKRQDTVIARQHLREMAEQAEQDGESTFTYGRLHAREAALAHRLDEGLVDLWSRIPRP